MLSISPSRPPCRRSSIFVAVFALPLAAENRLGGHIGVVLGQASYGFTPLINRAYKRAGHGAYFTELVLPVRFQRDATGDSRASIGVGIHRGFGF